MVTESESRPLWDRVAMLGIVAVAIVLFLIGAAWLIQYLDANVHPMAGVIFLCVLAFLIVVGIVVFGVWWAFEYFEDRRSKRRNHDFNVFVDGLSQTMPTAKTMATQGSAVWKFMDKMNQRQLEARDNGQQWVVDPLSQYAPPTPPSHQLPEDAFADDAQSGFGFQSYD